MSETFGSYVRKNRLEKDLSLRNLAELTGLDHSYIGRLEKGSSIPSRETVTKLASALNIPIDKLLMSAGYLPDIERHDSSIEETYIKKENDYMVNVHEGQEEYLTDINTEIEREIEAFNEKGIPIDWYSAKQIIEHRRRIMAGRKKCIDYIFDAKTLGDALIRIAEFQSDLKFDDETFSKLVIKARDKYGMPGGAGGVAAHGPSYPGSGVLDGDDE